MLTRASIMGVGGGNAVASYIADLVNRAYSIGGASVAEGTAMSGTFRPFTEEWTGRNWGCRTDRAVTNLLASGYAATDGVVGSGGAFPSGWSDTNTVGSFGFTQTLSHDSTSVTLRLQRGATGAGGTYKLYFSSKTATTVLANTAYNVSAYLKMAAGSLSNVLIVAMGAEWDTAGGSYVGETAIIGNQTLVQSDIDFPVEGSLTSPGTGVRCVPYLSITVGPNSAVDVTLKISKLQVTAGAERVPYTTNGSPIAADNLSISALNSTVAASAFGIDCTFRAPLMTGTGSVFQIGDSNNHIEVYLSGYSLKVATVASAGAPVVTTLGRALPWNRNVVSLTVANGHLRASYNGKPAVSCGACPGSLSGITLGTGTTGALGGSIEKFIGYPANDNDTRLKARSQLASVFDDFDRADGPIGTPPSPGVAWEDTTTNSAVAAISSTKLITTGGNPTNEYLLQDMGTAPYLMTCSMSWENQTNSAVMCLISTPNHTSPAATGIVALANHFLVNYQGIFAQMFSGGVLTGPQYTFQSAMVKDGTTVYQFGWLMLSDGSLVVRLHTGQIWRITAAVYSNFSGRFAIFEHYWNVTLPVRPQSTAWAAEAA